MCLASLLDEQNLALFNAIHLHLPLFPVLQIKGREAFKLEFLCHNSGRSAESGCLGLERSKRWGLFAKYMSETEGYEVQRRVHGREGKGSGEVLLFSTIK